MLLAAAVLLMLLLVMRLVDDFCDFCVETLTLDSMMDVDIDADAAGAAAVAVAVAVAVAEVPVIDACDSDVDAVDAVVAVVSYWVIEIGPANENEGCCLYLELWRLMLLQCYDENDCCDSRASYCSHHW